MPTAWVERFIQGALTSWLVMDTETIIEDILEREGGYINLPADHGGATNFGITKATLSQYRGRPVSVDEVQRLTRTEALEIYFKLYVEKPGFLLIRDDQLRALLVDYGVNSGPVTAIKELQSAVGTDPDGVLGPRTLVALHTIGHAVAYKRLLKRRFQRLASIVLNDHSQLVFLRGWINRCLEFI